MTENITLVIDMPGRVCYFLKIVGEIISLFQKHIKLPIHPVTSPVQKIKKILPYFRSSKQFYQKRRIACSGTLFDFFFIIIKGLAFIITASNRIRCRIKTVCRQHDINDCFIGAAESIKVRRIPDKELRIAIQ